jgi:hypothetical protein
MMLDMTEDEFYSKFEMVENHLDEDAELDGCMFETYGEELEYIKSLDGTKRVWTFLEGDEGNQYFMTGMRLVNRIGYFITTEPYTEEYEVALYSPTNE